MGFMAQIVALLLLIDAAVAAARLLQFNSHGAFKILQVADMHFANGATTKCLDVLPEQYAGCSDLNTTSFVKRMIDAEKPDLIVFTGDNIYASDCSDPAESLDAAFAPAVEAKLPWAAVLGNHDQESSLKRSGVMDHIVQMNYTLAQVNPAGVATIDGFGNYNLEVLAPGQDSEQESLLNLYFVDSGDYSTDPSIPGYGWVMPSQQAWLRNLSSSLQGSANQSRPALVFFHIPLPEVNNFTSSQIVGVKQEMVASPTFNSGFFQTLVEMGDVKAAFTGHDHVNDFCGELQHIQLCYGGGFGYHAYGKAGWSRRARVIEASLSDGGGGVEKIVTWKRLDDEMLSTTDKQELWRRRYDPSFSSSNQVW
ncbi:probable inactive purple acid phosphatase 29 [Selaginella moellendorffii]|nr:probable inactive purple acid phosphatase 29 [Selaginella moellendorffii]|eukprot:XP_002992267.2 probable inactive purple acid phosphatase 29 [Selaginella moellendorffii]